MGFNLDDSDEEEVPILVGPSDTPPEGVIGKTPITIVTGYLGAGSMFRLPSRLGKKSLFGGEN